VTVSPVTTANVQVPSDLGAPITFDFVSHALQVALIDREQIKSLPKLDWEQPGVYVLLGPHRDGKVSVYVGKATSLRGRLLQHSTNPPIDWWRAVAVARDTTDGFHSAQIGYLEGRLASQLRTAEKVEVAEGMKSIDKTLPDHQLIALDDFIPTILAALRIAGLSLAKTEEAKKSDTENVAPGKKSYSVTIAQLVAKGEIKSGDKLIFDQRGKKAEALVNANGEVVVDGTPFQTPSGAGVHVLGGKAVNGWEAWTLGSGGPTLAEIREKFLEENPQTD